MAFKRLIELSVGPKGGFGHLIKDNRIKFTAKKTNALSENTCEIEIYNLSDFTIDRIAKRDNFVSLRAGYQDEGMITNVFFGDVTTISLDKKGPDKVLTLGVTDGYTQLKNKPVTLSFQPGVTVGTIVSLLVTAIGLPLATPAFAGSAFQYPTGYSFAGLATIALSDVLRYVNLTWTVINNNIFIFNMDFPTPPQPQVYNISAFTGLIGFPEKLKETDSQYILNENVLNIKYKVKSVMIPQIIPTSLISVMSTTANGVFIVEAVTYEGDNWSGDFMNIMEVRSQ